FQSAWRFRHRAALGKPDATLAGLAQEDRVSAKYLATVWSTLEAVEEVGPLVKLQSMWRGLAGPRGARPERGAGGVGGGGARRCGRTSLPCARRSSRASSTSRRGRSVRPGNRS